MIRNHKEATVAMLLSDKVDFKTRGITKDRKGHFIMRKCQFTGKHGNVKCVHA